MRKITRFLASDVVYDEIASPVGNLTIITSPQGLHAILWQDELENFLREKNLTHLKKSANEKTILATKQQLKEYFQGERKKFALPIVMSGTEFQVQVWQQLLKIPYAESISYGEQAARLGDKNKARAVGMANGRNPISIVVPCHRVIGANGQLTGFGGGLATKAYLLDLEQRWK